MQEVSGSIPLGSTNFSSTYALQIVQQNSRDTTPIPKLPGVIVRNVERSHPTMPAILRQTEPNYAVRCLATLLVAM